MYSRRVPSVPYSVSPAYLKGDDWYVTVTIDNASSVERIALPEEMPKSAPDEQAAIQAEITAIKKKANAK